MRSRIMEWRVLLFFFLWVGEGWEPQTSSRLPRTSQTPISCCPHQRTQPRYFIHPDQSFFLFSLFSIFGSRSRWLACQIRMWIKNLSGTDFFKLSPNGKKVMIHLEKKFKSLFFCNFLLKFIQASLTIF
jgi:hypothetical protein